MKENKSGKIAKTAVFMVVVTICSKLLGMLRDVLLANGYGTTMSAVAFDTASRLPILIFDFVIGGVITASFIPVFNELLVKKGKDEALKFANLYVNVILVITVAVSALGVLLASPLVAFLAPDIEAETHALAVLLTRVMFPMIIFTGLAFSFVGLLQSFGKFLLPAVISLVSNLIMVLYFLTLDSRFGILGLAFAMVLGWTAQAVIQMPSAHALGYRFKPTLRFGDPYLKKSLLMALPILVSTWVQPFCNLLNTRFASSIDGGSAITAIGYANRLYIVIVGVFSFVATNLLFPFLSKAEAQGEQEESRKMANMSVRLLLLLILPITVGIFVLALPVCTLIYQRGVFTARDSAVTAQALACFALSMPFYAVNEVYTKKFFSKQNTVYPMISALCAIVANFAALYFLAPAFGVRGIALSGAVAVAVNVLLNHILLAKSGERIITASDTVEFLKPILSSAVMGVAVYFVYAKQPFGVLSGTVLSVLTGVVVYGALCLIVRQRDVCDVLKKLTGGRKNG